MKTPLSSSDPLLQSLTGEAADLPTRAAAEARKTIAQRRKNRQRAALVAAAFLLGGVTWNALPSVTKLQTSSPETGHVAGNLSVKPAVPHSLPTELDPEQAAFIKAAGDIPLLLVRNSAGKVTRIHLIER